MQNAKKSHFRLIPAGTETVVFNYFFDLEAIEDDVDELVSALEKINEADADALKEALQCFPGGHCPENREQRSALMDQFDDESFSLLEELDQIIWEQTLSEDYYAYIMANKEEFLAY